MKFLKWFGFALVVLIVFVGLLLAANTILPDGWTLSSEILLGLSAMGLSLVLSYWPKLRENFALLSSVNKSLVNLASVTLLAIVMYLGVCIELFEIPGLACSAAGIKQLVTYVFIAVSGNQLAYVASPQTSDVKEAKILRDVESVG